MKKEHVLTAFEFVVLRRIAEEKEIDLKELEEMKAEFNQLISQVEEE